MTHIYTPKEPKKGFFIKLKHNIYLLRHSIERKWLQFIRNYWYGPNWRADCRNKRPTTPGGEELYDAVKLASQQRRDRIALKHLRSKYNDSTSGCRLCANKR